MDDPILAINDKALQEHDFIEWQKAMISKRVKGDLFLSSLQP